MFGSRAAPAYPTFILSGVAICQEGKQGKLLKPFCRFL